MEAHERESLWMTTAPSLARLPPRLAVKSVRHARRPFMSAASWRHDIRNTTGVTPKSICIGPVWPDMANKNDWQSVSMIDRKWE